MKTHVTEAIWLNDQAICSIEQLSEVSGLSAEEINDLVESGAIVPVDSAARPRSFFLRYVKVARTARKLRDDFELDMQGLALALTLLQRIEELQDELAEARGRFRRTLQGR